MPDNIESEMETKNLNLVLSKQVLKLIESQVES